MSKRLGVRVALAIATLSVMTLLQGCGEDDGFGYAFVWAPVGSAPIPGFFYIGSDQGTAGATSSSGAGAGITAGTP
jgi:hypothetical protein